MEKLKQSFKDKLLNEDVMFKRINEKTTQRSFINFVNLKVLMTLSIVLTLIIAIVINNSSPLNPVKNTTQIGISTPQNKLAYAIVSVDINPSFELYIDIDDKVIEIIPLNDEAKTLSYESFIGLPVQDAVEEIIRKAQDAGFIDITNTTPNTVIISTISYGVDGTKLVKDIQIKLRSSLFIDRSIKSYIIKATDDDREKAKSENVSLGIYMLNGLIQNNGLPMSVQAFVSDLNNLELLEEYAENTTNVELVSVIQVLINELERLNISASEFQNRLNTEGEDLEELIEDLKDAFESIGYKETSSNTSLDESEDDEEDEDHSISESDDDEEDIEKEEEEVEDDDEEEEEDN
jgi:hypothetical protein